MDSYDAYARSPPPQLARTNTRERDDYRPTDSHRDRRRSPDRRRGGDRDRRRSRSPAQIDRYQPDRVPRDDYYRRDDRERRRSSPPPPSIDRYVPGQDAPAPALLVNPMPDPMKLEFQVGFTWFAEWWRTEQRIKEEKERQRSGKPPPRVRGERESREEREAERPKIQAAYDQYKENLQKTQAQAFVRAHRSEDWFRERYVPEVRQGYRQKLSEYRKGLFSQWERDLASGLFDEFTLEGIYKSESNGQGGILEKEEGETTAAAEVLGVGDLVPSKLGDLRDSASLQPTLLIKTIAPTVSREKFEAFAKEHLGEGEGGYKHLSLSDPNPLKKCHRMGWIILNPEVDEAMNEETEQQQQNGDEAEEGEAGAKPAKKLGTSEKALEKINSKTIEDPERGNFTVHCGVHRPPEAPRKKALWDLFSAPERISRDLDLATRLTRKLDNELGDEVFGVAKIEQRVHNLAEDGQLKPQIPVKAPKNSDDMDADVEEGDDEDDEGMVDEDEIDDEELLVKKKKLDLLVEYLRRVYNFCFFCVFESDSVHELQRKCPGGHLRRPRASLTSAAKETARASAQGEEFPLRKKSNAGETRSGIEGEDGEMLIDGGESPDDERKPAAMKPSARNAQQLQRAFNWVKTFEEKVLQLLEPENVDLRKIGGIPVEDGMEDEMAKYVKQEDTNKYRCKVPECTKLFKGVDFWRKHVEKRHPEWLTQLRQDLELVNTYVLDPSHIAPSRSDANSNGHFPTNSNAPTGTPRGFQLNPFGAPGAFGMPGGMPFNPSMQASFAAFNASGGGGVGPMRNMGRYGMPGAGGRMPGPYARPDGRGRLPSFSGGRPVMTMGIEGGAGAMGPREAVVGRSLRSYEDLDADTGGGTGELNY
ncbi:Hypothetical protein R9X50_00031800 [Acrodontium crateriforme]|uniref:C2H2-type domain-containing protein n=1 Tax=Acrodontium crateriforme TaxID=150365 RepID=A0AAQ3M315_9PEZI|nr:Hypothetical protein R9X50_00031800 [Acrodontium crateriforme]